MPPQQTPKPGAAPLPAGPALESLGRLLGAWNTEATHPALPGVVVPGTADIEWLEGDRFLIQRTRAEHPDFPDAISIIGLMDRDRVEPAQSPSAAAANTTEAPTPRLCMHYYDSRGVFRVYEAGADERTWRLWRDAPGFSQRFTGTYADGGDTIIGLWQVSREDNLWEDDLRITFRRRSIPLETRTPGMPQPGLADR